MIDLIERLELAAERIGTKDPDASAACLDAANRFRAIEDANEARRAHRPPSPIGRLRRSQKYALELMVRFGGRCPVITEGATTVVDGIPRIHWNTAVSLRRHKLVRLDRRSQTCWLTTAGLEAASYASRHGLEEVSELRRNEAAR